MLLTETELIPENSTYKVDASGRIIIPSHLRNRFGINQGDSVELFTMQINGEWYVCAKKAAETAKTKGRK